MRYFSILIFLITFFCVDNLVKAQDGYGIDNAPKKAIKMYKKAIGDKYKSKPDQRILALEEIIAKYPDFIEPYIDLAYLNYKNGLLAKAKENVSYAISLDSLYKANNYLILANYCKEDIDLPCEEWNLNAYLRHATSKKKIQLVQKRLEEMNFKKSIIQDYEEIDIIKLSETINNPERAQYKPVINVEGTEIVFTRLVNGQEDFYRSYLDSGQWTEAQAISSLNTKGNEGAHTVSADGKYMIYTRCNVPGRYRSCDLYISQNVDGVWRESQYIGVINTDSWESEACFSPDGNTIYFTSARPGGQGARDIYFITRKDGAWGDVTNMGDVINTVKNEESPFLHPDGTTLYFMSDGHPGLGGKDLFISKRNFDGSWTKPVNLGPSINSSQDEGGLFVDLAGEYAYFSKSEKINGKTSASIFKFRLPQKFRPEPTTYVKFEVVDGHTKEAIKSKLEFIEMSTNLTRNEVIPEQGKIMIVKQKEKYALTIDKPGYIFHSEKIDFDQIADKGNPIKYKIELYAIPQEPTADTLPPVSLRNLNFQTGSADLLSSSHAELDKLVSLLKGNEEITILLNGHTDNVGNDQDNLTLSRQRAESVAQYLMAQSIDASRMKIQAFGESQPIADNATLQGKAENRRIEFQVIYR